MSHPRSLTMSLAPLQSLPPSFSLDAPQPLLLPPASTADRRHSSVALNWPETAASTTSPPPFQPQLQHESRPSFFEQNVGYTTPSATPAVQFAAPPAQYVTRPQLQQHQPAFVPQVGTSQYQFYPWLTFDEKDGVLKYQSLQCRAEFSGKSPEELRLEDEALQLQQLQQQSQAKPFGTSTVGFFPSTSSAFNTNNSSQSAFSAFSTPSTFNFSSFSRPQSQPQQQQQQTAFSAFSLPQQQQQNTVPAWGTATAGFGSNWGTGGQSAFTSPFTSQPQQQQTFNFGFGTPSAFSFNSSFNFFSTQPSQTPQTPLFFFSLPAELCFQEWLRHQPQHISAIAFGGVSVPLPTLEECDKMRERERTLIASVDGNGDPFGVHLIEPITVPEIKEPPSPARSTATPNVPATPIQRGISSPLLQASRSPLLLPGNGSPGLLTPPVKQSRSHSVSQISASLSHSPRLGPLPPSPYAGAAAGLSMLGHTRSPSVPSTPERSTKSVSRNLFSQSSKSNHSTPGNNGANPTGLSPASILFSNNTDAASSAVGSSPSRAMTTHDHQAFLRRVQQQRDSHWESNARQSLVL